MKNHSVVVHCNAGGEYGMGHLMRTIAVAEEAVRRDWHVEFAGCFTDTAIRVLSAELSTIEVKSFDSVPSSEDWTDYLISRGPDVFHVDTYVGDTTQWRSGTWLLSNVQDGEFGRRPADLAIDPNLDAEKERGATDSSALYGIDYSLIRSRVRRQRRAPMQTSNHDRILVVMGGTDPTDATPRVIALLDLLPGRRRVTVIAPAHLARATQDAADHSAHEVLVIPFANDLPELAASHDLVISAAGTSMWDLACIGVPMALVCVIDNQEKGYRAAVSHGVAFPLGYRWKEQNLAEGFAALGALLQGNPQDAEIMAKRAFQLVDGQGSSRVLDEWTRRMPTSRLVDTF